LIHYDYQWKIGHNECQKLLRNELVPRDYQWLIGDNEYQNGLYVCTIKDLFEWISLYEDIAWVAYATIPMDAKIETLNTKIKSTSVILHEPLIPIQEFIHTAISQGADIHWENDYALRRAAEFGFVATTKLLVESGADIHIINDYPLRLAVQNNHFEIVKFLLEKGANSNANNGQAFHWASKHEDGMILQLLTNYKK
jgi:hypothetical protein